MIKIVKNNLLKIVSVFVLLTIVFASTTNASKTTVMADDYNDYEVTIIDDADLLDYFEEEKLEGQMKELTEYGNVVFYSLYYGGSDYENSSESKYYELYGNEPGVIFQIDMNNRQLTLSASTGMDKLIHKDIDTIVDNVYRYASDGDYYDCANECYKEVYMVVNDQNIAHTMKYVDNAILALILGLIINFYLAFRTTRNKISKKRILGEMAVTAMISEVVTQAGSKHRSYSPRSSSSGSGGSGGGGGGGGFSGSSGSHGF